jgi:hypothetical protein
MHLSTTLILMGVLLSTLVTLVASRYTSAGLIPASQAKKTTLDKARHKLLDQEETRRWLRFLLVIATALAPLETLCMALHVLQITPYSESILVLAPMLTGILTITLVRWRSFQDLDLQSRKNRSRLLAALAVINGANLVADPGLAVILLVTSAIIALVWGIGIRAGDRPLSIASLIVVIWFALFNNVALNNLLQRIPENVSAILRLVNTVSSGLAVLLPAVLLSTLLKSRENNTVFTLRLATALLLLSIAAYTAYQDAAKAATTIYQSADEYFPFLQLLIAAVGGQLLAAHLEKSKRLAGPAFTVLISSLIVLAFNLGWSNTPRVAALFGSMTGL